MHGMPKDLADMQVLHNLQTSEHGPVCVSFQQVAKDIEITIDKRCTCQKLTIPAPKSNGFADLPEPFRRYVDTELACAITTWALDADTVAVSRLNSGRTVRVLIPSVPPTSHQGSPRDLTALRRRVHSIGATLRPCMLSSLTGLDQLYEYQMRGTQWLSSRKAAILADDMGLGKTAQAISALRLLFSGKPLNTALIVCPKQLMANWEHELSKWAPELSWCRLTPPTKWREEAWNRVFNRVHVVITNYESVASILKMNRTFPFSVLILDEAHRVRNSTAQVTSDLRGIAREYTWALTGTPLERAPADVWTILSVIQPDRFNLTLKPPSDEALRARARPYVLRRMKRDSLPGLPPEVLEHQLIELLPRQRAAYDRGLDRFLAAPDSHVLAEFNKLRRLCDYDDESGQSAKLERIADILSNIVANQEKAVVFSHFLVPLDMLDKQLKRQALRCVHLRGDQSAQERDSALALFQRDPKIPILLASTRVGGEGLNLIEANHVVFVNRWWNPSANNQAKDRVSRIGQTRTVIVHSFTCRDTVEEVLDDIIEEKTRLSDTIVDALADTNVPDSILQEATGQLRAGSAN